MACDDGVTRFFGVDEGVPGLTYQRSLGRVEGRALSLAWHPAGATLFSGHSDAIIRAWNASNGREIYRIDAGERRTLQEPVSSSTTQRMATLCLVSCADLRVARMAGCTQRFVSRDVHPRDIKVTAAARRTERGHMGADDAANRAAGERWRRWAPPVLGHPQRHAAPGVHRAQGRRADHRGVA